MANYTAAALSAAQVAFNKQFSDPELRRKQNPALMLGIKNQQVTVVDHQELKQKDTMPVDCFVKTKRAASATAAKSATHAGTKSDSKKVTLSFIQIVEPFTVHLKQAQANVHKYAEMLGHELMESAKNIHSRAGTLSLAYLQTNRSQIVPSTGGSGTWNAANYALEIDAAKKDFFFQQASSFMRKQNYRGRLDVIADSPQFRKSQYIVNQGGGNNTNLAFQVGDMDVVETTEDIDANYTDGSALIIPQGGFAALPWNDPANRKGKGDYDSWLGGFGTTLDPLGSGLLFDFHAYTERADGSAAGGGIQDEKLEGELTLTIAWILAPLSTANETVVWEVAQMV